MASNKVSPTWKSRGRALPHRVQVIDLFSGCGGMSYGFHRSRNTKVKYALKGALDTYEHANATYSRMLGVTPLPWDIRELLKPRKLTEALSAWGISTKHPLLLIGCAPCQGFSSHRKRWAAPDEVRNSLLTVLARVSVRIRPDVVVMENVPELFHESNWHHYHGFKTTLERAGYRVRGQIHNLAQFGVPQERFRALVIASRIWDEFSMPKCDTPPQSYVTVRDAIGQLPPLNAGDCHADDPMHVTSQHRPSTVDLLKLIPPDGGSQRDLPAGAGPACLRRVDGFRDVYGRMFWDRPANAITTRCRTPSAGRYAHPEQHRGLSVREAALLQGFPSNYYFEGPFDDRFKQIGNAVSPVFARKVANHIAREWACNGTRSPQDLHNDVQEPITKSISSMLASIKRRQRERLHHSSRSLFGEHV